jgi:hypothetical protein
MRGHERYSDEALARFLHEVGAAVQRLQEPDGGPSPSGPWESEPEAYRTICIEAVRAARFGTTRQDHQRRWIAALHVLGWRKGPTDRARKTHPDLIEYDEMNQAQRDKVRVFLTLVTTLTLEE